MTAAVISNLTVELDPSGLNVVDDVSFSVEPGEIVGVVGESGSGKTTLGLALLGYARRGTRIVSGRIEVGDADILRLGPKRLREIRGALVAHVSQDPSMALNPALSIGAQLREVISAHLVGLDARSARDRLSETLGDVSLPSDEGFLRRYPHQLSGGQQQRICLAMAMLLRPRVLVLDEPTTGLDVSTQAHVLKTVRGLCMAHQVAGIYVSHDLSVVNNLADKVLVMYGGRLLELGPSQELFKHPTHPYTRRLLRAIPDVAVRRTLESIEGHVPVPGERPPGCVFAPRCGEVLPACTLAEPGLAAVTDGHLVRCIRAVELFSEPTSAIQELPAKRDGDSPSSVLTVKDLTAFHGRRLILENVTFELRPSECLALVGESGSGKTTLARTIVGLHAPRDGAISYRGDQLPLRARDRTAEVRRALQYIFQNPYSSLNPRRTIGDNIRVPIDEFFGPSRKEARSRVEQLLEQVALPGAYAYRYPDQLSGGERQRVAIARALACEPEVLICDEITSALDVSVQAAIVGLIERLRGERTMGVIFVTHNLALVRAIADRAVVLERGVIVEAGSAVQVLAAPKHPYTKQLIADTPSLKQSGAP